jgi:hypothetical protein
VTFYRGVWWDANAARRRFSSVAAELRGQLTGDRAAFLADAGAPGGSSCDSRAQPAGVRLMPANFHNLLIYSAFYRIEERFELCALGALPVRGAKCVEMIGLAQLVTA